MRYSIEYRVFERPEPYEHVDSPETLAQHVMESFAPTEEMRVIILDTKSRIISECIVARGGINSVSCRPVDIFRPVIMAGADRFIVAHNHPSGDPAPSEDDLVFTKRISKACEYMGLAMLDHVIIGDGDYFSFKKDGLI